MTAVLESYLEETAWLPASYTRPLSEEFISDGPKLRKFCELFWKTEDGKPFKLDPWQAWLIDHALERYPEDHADPDKAGYLRYRQVLISVARRNGKSLFAAVFGLYGLLMHEPGAHVVGVARNVEQANIIYRRVKHVIDSDTDLQAMLKTTGTRGITLRDKPGVYAVKAANADSLQGHDTSLCLFDEVHLCHPDMWQALVQGTDTFDNGMVLGITTAGDDNSILLKSLYERGRKASAGQLEEERFGFFCWEAPDGLAIDDPVAILAANPSIACGRLPLSRAIDRVRTEPLAKAMRFTHNRFVSGSEAWLDMHVWLGAATGGLPAGTRAVLTVDRAPGQVHASVTATAKVEGRFYSELVEDVEDPTDERLLAVCKRLGKHNPIVFVMDKYSLGNLAKLLEMEGYPVKVMQQGDVFNASEFAFKELKIGRVSHDGNAKVTQQIPYAKVKDYGERWRLVRNGSGYIDMLHGFIFGTYVAETYKEVGIQLL